LYTSLLLEGLLLYNMITYPLNETDLYALSKTKTNPYSA
jgi:hypothetical protein